MALSTNAEITGTSWAVRMTLISLVWAWFAPLRVFIMLTDVGGGRGLGRDVEDPPRVLNAHQMLLSLEPLALTDLVTESNLYNELDMKRRVYGA